MKTIKDCCPNWKKCKLRKETKRHVSNLEKELKSCDSMPRYSELEAIIKELKQLFNL